jgi:Putative undecaprenyl diphosphate synthase
MFRPQDQHPSTCMSLFSWERGDTKGIRLRAVTAGLNSSVGFPKFPFILQIYLKPKIRCVTAYAFAIDNFRRGRRADDTGGDLHVLDKDGP